MTGSGRRLRLLDHVRQVVAATDAAQLQPRNVLCPLVVDQDDTVLLQVVSDARYIGWQLLAVRQSNHDTLAIGRVRLLGLLDDGLDHEAPHLALLVQRVTSFAWLDRSSPMDVKQFALILPVLQANVVGDQRSKLLK